MLVRQGEVHGERQALLLSNGALLYPRGRVYVA